MLLYQCWTVYLSQRNYYWISNHWFLNFLWTHSWHAETNYRRCSHVTADLGPGVGLGCWHGVSMSPEGRNAETRQRSGPRHLIKNTDQAKICFAKAHRNIFPQYFCQQLCSYKFKACMVGQSKALSHRLSPAEIDPTPGHRKPRIPTNPRLLLSLAGAAGDQGLPRLRPGGDRAAGGGVHRVHTPGGTSDFYKEEAEEGKSFNCGMNGASWIWEDLTPPSSVTGRCWKTAATIICSNYL